jgi:DNA-binding LytR/AlgR family response regulator
MVKIKTIIVDDEPKAIEIIERYCNETTSIVLNATFRNPIKALEYLNTHPTDLLFLDINMPKLNGMELIDLIESKPAVVFTTAYSEYAVGSYEYNVLDYLLKPISFKRFLKAVKKYHNAYSIDHLEEHLAVEPEKVIHIKSGPQVHRINTKNILYLEKDGNYLIFHTKNKRVLSRQNMKDIFEILNQDEFIRIHKSFVIAKSHIDVIESNQIKIADRLIPIGRSFRNEIDQLIAE